MTKILTFSLLAFSISAANADEGSFTNSGGSGNAGTGVSVTSSVATPAGSLTLNCPGVSTGACAVGNLTFLSNDGTMTIAASFTSGTFAEGCSGGGKGGHVTCSYTFTGYFSGTLTLNNRPQTVTGVTSQAFGTGGAAATGITAYNSAYIPFYYSDSEQIHRSDDLLGTNQISYGAQGAGVGQFYGAYGIAVDYIGRIYIADTYNCRVVRIDDMKGTNWRSYGGTCGSGVGQFNDPSGIAVDSAARIYVMDTGNSRIVRIDNMSGANWVSYGTVGSGVGQFAPYLGSVALDSSGRIYVPDTGNARLVRIDDMTGGNWTVLTQSPVVNGVSYSFQSPAAVALDSTGRIYVADNTSYQPAVIRVDDMTGANWTSIYTGVTSGLNSISVDSSGTVFLGGGGAHIVVNMAAVLNSSGNIGPIGSYYVFGVTPVRLPNPRPSAIGFSPAALTIAQNVGATSPPVPLTISNFGGSPLDIFSISTTGAFAEANNCPAQLVAGSSCTASVTFSPSVYGPSNGLLTVADDSGNLGASQAVALSGFGTAPAASLSPTSLNFPGQVLSTTSAARNITLENTGTGPMQVTVVITLPPFSQTNNCGTIAPGASCTIQVTFTPAATGSASGTLTIADSAGTGTQTANLTGTGISPVVLSTTNLTFGSVAVRNTSPAGTITLVNRQSVPLSISNIVATAPFAVASNTCGTGIAALASCTVGVTFSPTAIGLVTGTLTLTDSAITSPQTVNLTGIGSAPVALSPTTLNFNTVAIGNNSAPKTVSLTNHKSVSLVFTNIAVSAGFAVASNTCGSGLAAGATCTVSVTFSPTSAGAATGTLTFTDSSPDSPQTVSLTGTGSLPVTLSSNSLNLGAVTLGNTSNARSVTLTNRQNVPLSFSSIAISANFNLVAGTCGTGIAAGGSCTVSVTFTPTAKGAATGTLTFTDTAANSPQTVSLAGTGR